MIKKAIGRGISSFMFAVGVNVVLTFIFLEVMNKPAFIPIIPEFAARFSSHTEALLAQWLLIGLTSAAFGFWSIIMELERWSLLLQSIVFFILTAMVWIPVAIICWGFGKYIGSFIGVGVSYMIAYIVTWMIQYRICKQNVEKINRRLEELNE